MKGEISDKELNEIRKALVKKASGYMCEEVTNEYSISENGEERLLKKKVSKKYVPSDLAAVKMLFEMFSEKEISYENYSDIELDKEAVKLFKEYQTMSNINLIDELNGGQNGVGKNSNKNQV